MKKRLIGTLIASVVFSSPLCAAGNADAGKAKAGMCAACHGMDGISAAPIWPNLAGQKEQYLVKQLKAFREGTRSEPTMTALVSSLSDEDIANLAAYYSSLGNQ